ncbi:MAG: methyltransferase domain-containing protein [Pseudomonadota bacterium]
MRREKEIWAKTMDSRTQILKSADGSAKTEILAYGIRALCARHREIRKLKRSHSPSFQGFRVWPSSWLLMDFFKHRGLREGSRIVEVGCGWGLAGIYCAKNHGAVVTGVDIDSEVFPYLRLHAEINEVDIATIKKGIDGLTGKYLEDFDCLIGADICFWDNMVDSLKGLIHRAFGAGIQSVIITDPGRSPFEQMGRYFVEKWGGEVKNWGVDHPHRIQGRILKIRSFTC